MAYESTFITDASKGIGLATAHVLAAEGYSLHLAARILTNRMVRIMKRRARDNLRNESRWQE